MTKKHFQQLAGAIYKARGADCGVENHRTLRPLIEEVAGICAASNRLFDRARFVEACETGKCKGMKGVGK